MRQPSRLYNVFFHPRIEERVRMGNLKVCHENDAHRRMRGFHGKVKHTFSQ